MKSRVVTIASTQIAASGELLLGPFDMESAQGLLALQLAITQDGQIKVEALGSLDKVTYLEHEGADDMATGLSRTSGPESNGKVIFDYALGVCASAKIRITETGGAQPVTIAGSYMFR